jgi:hypothetical protein
VFCQQRAFLNPNFCLLKRSGFKDINLRGKKFLKVNPFFLFFLVDGCSQLLLDKQTCKLAAFHLNKRSQKKSNTFPKKYNKNTKKLYVVPTG